MKGQGWGDSTLCFAAERGPWHRPGSAGCAEQGGVVWGWRPFASWVCPAFNLSETENSFKACQSSDKLEEYKERSLCFSLPFFCFCFFDFTFMAALKYFPL